VVCDEVCRLAEDATDAEVGRAKAQLKAGLLMSLESTMSRCEQLGQQFLIFGRHLTTDEVVGRIAEIDAAAVRNAARKLRRSRPTVTVMGPLAGVEDYERIAARLA
jgi:predicted Zn-dependent peptidase